MARMPGARWLGEHSPRRPMQRYDIVCLHTIVGFAPAHAAHFSVHHDGTIDQSRDTEYQSGANLDGNYRVIAIENEDHGAAFGNWNTNDGHAVPPFTNAQIEANAKILAWAHKTHGVPLQLCPNSRPTSKGLAYHRQGIDGNFGDYDYPGRVSGGEVWTESRGKVCPGDKRISARDRILVRARVIVGGTPVPPALPKGQDSMVIITPYGSTNYRAICFESTTVVALTELGFTRMRERSGPGTGITYVALPNADVAAIQTAFGRPELIDIVGD